MWDVNEFPIGSYVKFIDADWSRWYELGIIDPNAKDQKQKQPYKHGDPYVPVKILKFTARCYEDKIHNIWTKGVHGGFSARDLQIVDPPQEENEAKIEVKDVIEI